VWPKRDFPRGRVSLADETTREEIGAQFGVSRERIRQIEYQALKKLRKRIEKLEAPRQAAWN